MRHYETTYILRPNLGEEQFTEIIDRTNAIITNDGGSIICLDRWGMRRLAYEINKEVQGYYVYLNYAAPSNAVDEIERIFRIDDRALRYLTIKLGDSMTAEAIEMEKQRIAEKAAAREKAQAEAEEGADFDNDDNDNDNNQD
jgi:small subunit ribosomal protein S6